MKKFPGTSTSHLEAARIAVARNDFAGNALELEHERHHHEDPCGRMRSEAALRAAKIVADGFRELIMKRR